MAVCMFMNTNHAVKNASLTHLLIQPHGVMQCAMCKNVKEGALNENPFLELVVKHN